jgi:hypothetical protein
MKKSISTKKRGRPKTTGKGELIGVRILPPFLKELDAWIAGREPRLSRPEAIRRFVEQGLARSSKVKAHIPDGTSDTAKQRKAKKAREMAHHAVERIVDKSVSSEEQERRKRALIKGPKEFREIREDLTEPKKR